MDITIGQKIRQYREEKRLTQQELELAIGASFGHISRIESGKINSTKETLLKIIEVLELNNREKDYLLGIIPHFPKPLEVISAIKESKQYIDNCINIAFLNHEFGFVYYCNSNIFEIADFENDKNTFITKFFGKNCLEIIFDYSLKFREKIQIEYFDEIALNQINIFMVLSDYKNQRNSKWYKDLMVKCKNFEKFNELWEKAESLPKESLRASNDKVIHLDTGKGRKSYYITITSLIRNPYFEIVEYVPIKK